MNVVTVVILVTLLLMAPRILRLLRRRGARTLFGRRRRRRGSFGSLGLTTGTRLQEPVRIASRARRRRSGRRYRFDARDHRHPFDRRWHTDEERDLP